MTAPYRLHYAPDNASLIVRLVLEELRVPYQATLVDRARKGQQSPAYLRLNPNGLIPVLETPHGPVFETGAILLWLADTHHALAPAPDAADRGAFLKWLFFTSNTLHADLRMTFYPETYVGPNLAAQTHLRRRLHDRLRRHLTLLDAAAADAPGWLHPERPCVLDYYVACLMRWMALYPVDGDRSWFHLADTTHLHAMLMALETRPAVIAAQTAEGLGPTPFTAPSYATPPEGSAT
jgi:glutathione S-transferase